MATGGLPGNTNVRRADIGGAGSGGAIRLIAPLITGNGKLVALGGVENVGFSVGGLGRVRIEATQNTFVGTASGDVRTVTLVPNPVILSSISAPSIRIVSIGGVAVPSNPQGRFDVVDVTLDTAQELVIALEGRNIPAGTTITVNVINETNGAIIVDSTPLAGTGTTLSATAAVTIPSGFSQIFTRATW